MDVNDVTCYLGGYSWLPRYLLATPLDKGYLNGIRSLRVNLQLQKDNT
jgi:hypothetical protein